MQRNHPPAWRRFGHAAALCLLTIAAPTLIGCKGGDDMVPVSGTIKNADGSPLQFDTGTIMFIPTGPGASATGGVEKDGSFTMMTKKPGDGIRPGSYKVVLQIMKSYREQTSAVSAKYGDQATTPLEATVDSDHTHFDFTVEK